MKRFLPWLLLYLLVLGVLLAARERDRRTAGQAWQILRFRDPQASLEQALAWQAEQEVVRRRRQAAGFQKDVEEAVKAEMEVWKRQFHLGDQDRSERLALQRLSEPEMKVLIREQLLDEAFLETGRASAKEKEARDWYSAHREELRIPELHRVSHLFLSSHDPKRPDRRGQIEALRAQIQQEGDFQRLVALHSEDARSRPLQGDLGWMGRRGVPPEFLEAVKKLPVGQISPPVRTSLGWHLLRVTERQKPRIPAFEEVREEILAMLSSRDS